MQSYHNVAELRQFNGTPPAEFTPSTGPGTGGCLTPAPVDLDVEVADLLAQGIAVEAEQVGGANLVAAGGGERGRKQRDLDLLEDAVIEAGRRHAVRETREVRGEIGLHGAAEIFHRLVAAPARRDRRRRELTVDDGGRDDILRIER